MVYPVLIWIQLVEFSCFLPFSCVCLRQSIKLSLLCQSGLRLCVWGVFLVVRSRGVSRGSGPFGGLEDSLSGFTALCLSWISITRETIQLGGLWNWRNALLRWGGNFLMIWWIEWITVFLKGCEGSILRMFCVYKSESSFFHCLLQLWTHWSTSKITAIIKFSCH